MDFLFTVAYVFGGIVCDNIVALSSVLSAVVNTMYIYFVLGSKELFLGSLIFTIVMIIRHRANFERMLRHEENKIKWM